MSTRVQQISNKRSIDRDVKEFFAIKNTAHQKFENSYFEKMITDASKRNFTDISYRMNSQTKVAAYTEKSNSPYKKTQSDEEIPPVDEKA